MLADWRTAAIPEPLRLALAFAEKLTRTPGEVAADDVRPLLAGGLSREQVEDVIAVVACFSLITRVADALDFDVPTVDVFDADAKMLLKRGYRI